MMWCYMKYLKGIIQVLGIKKYDDILICKKDFSLFFYLPFFCAVLTNIQIRI